ncbi:MAG TPA: cytochrome c biogenesis protein CcsA [Bacteroidota bacterium]|nr:cytochrome c biogenesis protein CcsA [Bacteroidota bacterium]
MRTIVNLLTVALPLLYFGTVWSYAKAFFKDSAFAKKVKTPLLLSTLILHLAYLLLRTELFNHPPITTVFEIMSIISFSIAGAYAVIEFLTKVKNTGYFILNLAFIFQTFSSCFIENLTEVNPVLRSHLLGIHVSSALLGYAAITISAVYGFLYLMLYHHIKSSQFGVIYNKLPNLETLERMSMMSIVFGFFFLTVAIGVGLFWLPRAFQHFSYFDPKLIGTIFIWAMYGVGLAAKRTVGWQGKKIMILSIIAFAVAFFSLTIINVYFSGFHKFY